MNMGSSKTYNLDLHICNTNSNTKLNYYEMIDWLMLATCPNYDGQVTNENRQMFLTSSVSP